MEGSFSDNIVMLHFSLLRNCCYQCSILGSNECYCVHEQVQLHLSLDFKKAFRYFLLFFSGCLSSFGHPYGMEGIMADPTRDLDSGNKSVIS